MSFNHKLVPEPDKIKVETINGTRYYILPDGTRLKSVTTILGEKMDKSALIKWRKKVGETEAKKISSQAAHRGSALHKIAERYVLNEDNYMSDKEMPLTRMMFNSIKPHIDKNVDNILGIELLLYNKALRTAGRTDLIAEWNGVPSVIDFKQSNKPKKEEWILSYFLQTTIYSMMFEWTYGIKVPQIVIVMAVELEAPQIFIKDRGDYVEKVLEIFRPSVFNTQTH